uniref:Uncharacterized protein n=1 Tax=Streptomyces sp. FR1 TaxID=349971 RepID=V9Z2D8_9ACTN|nr:hypothetical protein pFRL2_52 [Streptomyces sp. FR1]
MRGVGQSGADRASEPGQHEGDGADAQPDVDRAGGRQRKASGVRVQVGVDGVGDGGGPLGEPRPVLVVVPVDRLRDAPLEDEDQGGGAEDRADGEGAGRDVVAGPYGRRPRHGGGVGGAAAGRLAVAVGDRLHRRDGGFGFAGLGGVSHRVFSFAVVDCDTGGVGRGRMAGLSGSPSPPGPPRGGLGGSGSRQPLRGSGDVVGWVGGGAVVALQAHAERFEREAPEVPSTALRAGLASGHGLVERGLLSERRHAFGLGELEAVQPRHALAAAPDHLGDGLVAAGAQAHRA